MIIDQSGKVRIWDTVNKEHILKNEFHPFGGPIKDIAWSPDNQRMVVVGEGRERFGHVFMSETGTSVGEISGQSKPINSCDFRPTRPFRIVTGSEDNTIAVFEGPPFKFKMTKQVSFDWDYFRRILIKSCNLETIFKPANKRLFAVSPMIP